MAGFNEKLHVTEDGIYSKGITTFNVETSYGYNIKVRVSESGLVRGISYSYSLYDCCSYEFPSNHYINKYIKKFELKNFYRILYYFGIEVFKFFEKSVKESTLIYLDIYKYRYKDTILVRSTVSKNLCYFVSLPKNSFTSPWVTLEDLFKRVKDISWYYKPILEGILTSKDILLKLVYNRQDGKGLDLNRGIRELIFTYPYSIERMDSTAIAVIKSFGRVVAVGESLRLTLDEIISARPRDSNDSNFKDIELWSEEWFKLWEYSLYLKKLDKNGYGFDFTKLSLYCKESGKLYDECTKFKKLLQERIHKLRVDYRGVKFYNQGKVKEPMVYYSLVDGLFKAGISFEYQEGSKRNVVSCLATYTESTGYKDFIEETFKSVGFQPERVIRVSTSLTKSELIASGSESNSYGTFIKGETFYIIDWGARVPYGYKFVLSKKFRRYLKRMISSGRMVDYWADVYEFLEALNEKEIDYLITIEPSELVEYAYKIKKYSSLASHFLFSLSNKEFTTRGVEDAIRLVYNDAKKAYTKGMEERKRLKEEYNI